jgi:hypothetical protein
MSLRRKPTMTERGIAANRANGRRSRGRFTAQSREGVRAALRCHGFDAPAEELAMRALGEDPALFQELLERLWAEYDPAGAAQEGLVIRLARATWLMNRADRTQEGYALRRAQEVSSGRQDRLHVQMMRLKITEDGLRLLLESVEDEHYVTTPEHLEKAKNLHQDGVLKEMGEVALALFCQLQAPGTDEDGIDEYEKAKKIVRDVKMIFGVSSGPEDQPASPQLLGEGWDARYPRISPEEWERRQRPRQLLENILRRQVETCADQRKAARAESRNGPSPYERSAEIAPTHRDALLLRRMQDSHFREVRRVTNLLLKIQRYARRMAAAREDDENDGGADV